ncbi:hypothetical protein B1M_03589 [Burkholderia sp. TJI49]|nr:hypothetical protein B1M_03589 [Burkholderia sp. TJI49]
MRLKAELQVLVVAGLVTEAAALCFSSVTQAATGEVHPFAFGLFCAMTFALVHRWVLADADDAFKTAVLNCHVQLEGTPPHITYIDSTCPRRWYVLLYIFIRPELIDQDVE